MKRRLGGPPSVLTSEHFLNTLYACRRHIAGKGLRQYPSPMKRTLKILRNTGIALVAIFILLSGFLQYVHYPSLISAVRLGLAPASKTPTLLPWHTVDPSATPVVWKTGT